MDTRRELSTRATNFYRRLLPLMLAGLSLIILTAQYADTGRGPPQGVELLLVVCVFLVLGGLALYLWRARRVWLDQQVLVVSGSGEELRVPLKTISKISATRLFNPEQIRVHYRSNLGADESFVFIPALRWFKLGSPHPLVAEMRQWVADASSAGQQR